MTLNVAATLEDSTYFFLPNNDKARDGEFVFNMQDFYLSFRVTKNT